MKKNKKKKEKRKLSHPAKIDLNKMWLPKQKTIQHFNIDAQGFRKKKK